jgi:hypothetical protein
MVTEPIITALISGGCVAIPSIIATIVTNHQESKERHANAEKSKTLQDVQFERIELKLEEQNKNSINITGLREE